MELIKHLDTITIKKKNDRYVIILQGYVFDKNAERFDLTLCVNDKKVSSTKTLISRKEISKKYAKFTPKSRCGFRIQSECLTMDTIHSLSLLAINDRATVPIIVLGQSDIKKHFNVDTLEYHIDHFKATENDTLVQVDGYAFSYITDSDVSISLLDENGNEIMCDIQMRKRNDLFDLGMIPEYLACGFTIIAKNENACFLRISCENEFKKIPLENMNGNDHASARSKSKVLTKLNYENGLKAWRYLKKHGPKELAKRLIRKSNVFGVPYEKWYHENKVTKEEYEKQCNVKFKYEPLVSIVVPTYNTPLNFLHEMIDSVISQSYKNWELCIADGSTQQEVINVIKSYANKDKRIHYCLLDKNYGISGNTNKALELATGEYVGLFDHDDLLTPDCLYEVINSIQNHRHDIIYTDEDKTDSTTQIFKEPNFKTDYNVDLFYSHNYITHFFVVKKSIIDQVGGFRSEYDGAQDYDVMFRCIEKSNSIHHISKILYHWRMHEASTAENPESKMYCYEAGKKAIDDHFKRIGVSAEAEVLNLWGLYRIHYQIKDNPLISIIIPNKDNVTMLRNCIDSLYEVNQYQNFEIIIVENNSKDHSIFEYYKQIEREYSNIKIVMWEKEFNYSAINNFGVSFAKGDYILFLNNDTEVINKDSVSDMLGLCMRADVGIVGAKLLYPNDTVQHAGIVLGIGGFADHVFRNADSEEVGYMARARINCDYSAVTAACMMVKKEVFLQVGGFDEEFKVGLNDVDFCLKVRDINKLVVFDAFSLWYHYESITRGYENTKEKSERFQSEIKLFKKKWETLLCNGDPYYNSNFITNETSGPFKLR